MQDADKAVLFLRAIREMVFLEKKNITKLEYLMVIIIILCKSRNDEKMIWGRTTFNILLFKIV